VKEKNMDGGFRELVERGFLKQCTEENALKKALREDAITLYAGFDPTGSSLHVGHLIPLFAMAHLQQAGHRVIALIGGGTALIGDPSGKTEARKMLTVEEIQQNGESFKEQMASFIDFDGEKALLLDNTRWLADLNYIDFLRDIGRHFSVNRMLSFETYKARMETGLSFIEFNYQLLQSYDYLELNRRYNCRLQIGGDDQWGNIVAGVDLIRRVDGRDDVYGLTFPLITRADGKKMGKTEKGALFLDPTMVSPYEFYQYWRNVADSDVDRFLKLYTFLPLEEITELSALDGEQINTAKERLAYEITSIVHGSEEAEKAKDAARAAFGGEGTESSGIPSIELFRHELEEGIGVLELFAMTDLCSSKGEARRLVRQGGATVNEQRVDDITLIVDSSHAPDDEIMLRAGKKRYYRVLVVDT
jgi:tyrosyl-tRNA synthetase